MAVGPSHVSRLSAHHYPPLHCPRAAQAGFRSLWSFCPLPGSLPTLSIWLWYESLLGFLAFSVFSTFCSHSLYMPVSCEVLEAGAMPLCMSICGTWHSGHSVDQGVKLAGVAGLLLTTGDSVSTQAVMVVQKFGATAKIL